MKENYKTVLIEATKIIKSMKGQKLKILELYKPLNDEDAMQLVKTVSKLSPLLGNHIEYMVIKQLNNVKWISDGIWMRQDPGFPDAIFVGSITPAPGIEIKTWFPFSTEITARFKDSSKFFEMDQTFVSVIAWIPENIIWGVPIILDVWVGSALDVANQRDKHYHRPPDYLVIEPEMTDHRTANLRQTNVNGYKFQGNDVDRGKATEVVASWGENQKAYSNSVSYQRKLHQLMGQFRYRLDTNFAKIDRIELESLEEFKSRVLEMDYKGKKIKEWADEMFNDNQDDETI